MEFVKIKIVDLFPESIGFFNSCFSSQGFSWIDKTGQVWKYTATNVVLFN